MTEVVKIYQLVENLSLEVVYGDEESLNRTIKT
ncbi:HPr kinase/phosphorylase, partial [Enterococcus gallinarum]|nr:HPr kinase/phosphorylase [Enterococcus gallinarum]